MKLIKTIIPCLLIVHFTYAQNGGALPKSYQLSLENNFRGSTELFVKQELLEAHQSKYSDSPIISYPTTTNFTTDNTGEWVPLETGGAIWRHTFQATNAQGLAIFIEAVDLPLNSEIWMYSPKYPAKGKYYRAIDLIGKEGWSGIQSDNQLIIECFVPNKKGDSWGAFALNRMDYIYDIAAGDIAFGESADCHDNVNCSEGDDWEPQKRSICRIQMVLQEGVGFCTGNVMNNTNQDTTPYILSAFHCQDGFTPVYGLWFFDFNYEFDDCQNQVTPPDYISMVGCTQRAGRRQNDMLLLELNQTIPNSFGVYYLGWDRNSSTPSRSINIHHPIGDVKKITIFEALPTIFNNSIRWNNEVTTPSGHHFSVLYERESTFESGSSGSALINNEGRVVGQLHGGVGHCDTATVGYFARLSLAWEGGGSADSRLKDWLDPQGTEPMTLDGLDVAQADAGNISGRIVTTEGRGIPGVTIQLGGSVIATAETNEEGRFEFTQLPLNQNYSIDISRPDTAKNGISIVDVIRVRKHIQNIENITDPYQLIAADVNGSENISVIDVIKLQKLILNIDTGFEDVSIWRYIPMAFTFTNDLDPWEDVIPSTFVINNFTSDIINVDFVGIKSGDLDDSASF